MRNRRMGWKSCVGARVGMAGVAGGAGVLALVAAVALGSVSGCAVDVTNRHAAQEIEARGRAPGSAYLGWRIYQQRCAACHGDGVEPLGAVPGAPDLRERMRGLGPQRFVDLVLRRYDGLTPGSPRDTLIDDLLAGRGDPITMPPWNGEPLVQAHVIDLYAYLSARSDGRLGPARPPGP